MNTGMHLLFLILFKQDFIEMWPGAGLTLEEDGGPIDRVLIKRVLHTTQEVSSWSIIVCIPVSPVAIYPVFKSAKQNKSLES